MLIAKTWLDKVGFGTTANDRSVISIATQITPVIFCLIRIAVRVSGTGQEDSSGTALSHRQTPEFHALAFPLATAMFGEKSLPGRLLFQATTAVTHGPGNCHKQWSSADSAEWQRRPDTDHFPSITEREYKAVVKSWRNLTINPFCPGQSVSVTQAAVSRHVKPSAYLLALVLQGSSPPPIAPPESQQGLAHSLYLTPTEPLF